MFNAVSYRINTGHAALWHVNAEHAVKFNRPKLAWLKIPLRSFEILYLTTPVCGLRLLCGLKLGACRLLVCNPMSLAPLAVI